MSTTDEKTMKTTTNEINRTQAEIVARIEEVAERDRIGGTERSQLMLALSWADASRYMRPGAPHSEVTWEAETRIKDAAMVRSMIVEDLPRAWQRACMRRGTSVLRWIGAFRAALWLLGPGSAKTLDVLEDPEGFSCYGKPYLVAVSEHVGVDWRALDDDRWVETVETETEDEEVVTADQALGR